MQHESIVHSSFDARGNHQVMLTADDFEDMTNMDAVLQGLRRHGICISAADAKEMAAAKSSRIYAMDNIQQPLTSPSIATPVQFLQGWLPGNVQYLTAAREIDELVGIATVGSWEDEQIVQTAVETTGAAVPYGDQTNVPFTNWNPQFNTRTIVRFESGMRVGRIEEMRAARMRISSSDEKRNACVQSLDIARNSIGFYGYNDFLNNTYGFLNDPNLPAYVEVAASGSGSSTLWANKTFLEIQADILSAIQSLRTQSKNTIKPDKTPMTMAVAMSAVDYLATTSDFGISVRDWLAQFYPNIRVESAPQLDAAHSSLNVFYLYADKVTDASTDGGATFIQPVPAKFQVIGVAQSSKFYEEDYANATAGVMCKRPFAVVRRFGI